MEMEFYDLLQVCDSGQSDTCYVAAWNSDAPPAEVQLFSASFKKFVEELFVSYGLWIGSQGNSKISLRECLPNIGSRHQSVIYSRVM